MKIVLIPFLFIFSSTISQLQSEETKITAEKTGSRINVTINGKFFTSYIFSDNEKYPFFFPVNGPISGGSVTSMRNADYPHHSSLFLGCDLVNGGNFWQEGLDRGQIKSLNAVIEKQHDGTLIITDNCIWIRPGATSPISDKRRFIITSPSQLIYQIDVEIILEMLTDVRILKTNHSLFSARIAPDLSVVNGGLMINAEGDQGEKETFGKRSSWMDCYGKRGKNMEGIAIMQHPSNPWYPSQWFTRDYGFISPTPFFWPRNDIEMFFKKGTVLKLRYRVVVHGGNTDEADIAGIFEQYKKLK